jgi:hypothetical protein
MVETDTVAAYMWGEMFFVCMSTACMSVRANTATPHDIADLVWCSMTKQASYAVVRRPLCPSMTYQASYAVVRRLLCPSMT